MSEKIIFAPKPNEDEPWDVAIIGSGPAALTAAIYTTRGAASTLILGGAIWGGQLMLTSTVDNFPGFPEGVEGPELMGKMKAQAERFGAEFVASNVTGIDFEKTPFQIALGDTVYRARSIILATGAKTKWLDIKGEKELIGRGVSSCAPCDAPFFKDKKVAIVGGGDSAMEEALVMTKYASHVFVIHRRDSFRASQAMQTRVFEKEKEGKITIIWDTEVLEMKGKEKLEGLMLKTKGESKLVQTIASGFLEKHGAKLQNESENETVWELPLDGTFVAIGHIPASEVFARTIEVDEKGYVKKVVTPEHHMSLTNMKGVFVAGDLADTAYRQAITAAGFGCMAGMDTLRYLDKATPSW